jgi:formylmethanofuran dehydrogenase subunit B
VASGLAVAAAARLLGASRSAVVAGLGTDVAGARAAVTLARAVGGAVDHMDAGAALANLDVMRRAGWIVTTPLQTRARADTVLLVGPGLSKAWPEMADRLALDEGPTVTGGVRRVLHLFSDRSGEVAAEKVLPALGALRAILAGRAVTLDAASTARLRKLAAALSEARFGVAVWAPGVLDTLAVEMLCGLVADLNRTTRFAGLPLAVANGAEAVMQAVAWSSGFPVRVGFAGAAPVHDAWRFDAARMVASGEADVAVWISAFSGLVPEWGDAVPTIALVPPGTSFRSPPAVVFEVGCPGRDHDAMLFDPALGGIAFAAASGGGGASVAGTLGAITAALPKC